MILAVAAIALSAAAALGATRIFFTWTIDRPPAFGGGSGPDEKRDRFLPVAVGGLFGLMTRSPANAVVAWGLVWTLLRVRGRQRSRLEREQSIVHFPDYLDLMTLALSAGLNLPAALSIATRDGAAGPVKRLFQRILRDVESGRDLARAFEIGATAASDGRHAAVFRYLAEASTAGHDVVSWLSAEAQFERDQWFLEMEARSRTASLRLLVPTLLLLFPTTFVLLLAPLYLRYRMGLLPF